jgi:hypothetical protein
MERKLEQRCTWHESETTEGRKRKSARGVARITSSGWASEWSLYLRDEGEEVGGDEREWERRGEDASSELQLALKASSDFGAAPAFPSSLPPILSLLLIPPPSPSAPFLYTCIPSAYGSQPRASPSILPCLPSLPPFPFRRGPLRPLSPAHRDVSLRVGCRISENCLD